MNKTVFETELKKELVSSHPLAKLELKAVRKNARNDDVLFYDGITFYIIHLIWTMGTKYYPYSQKIHAQDIVSILEQDLFYMSKTRPPQTSNSRLFGGYYEHWTRYCPNPSHFHGIKIIPIKQDTILTF